MGGGWDEEGGGGGEGGGWRYIKCIVCLFHLLN